MSSLSKMAVPKSCVSAERRSVLCDTQRLGVAVETYGNYRALACIVSYEICELNSHGSAFSVPNPRGPLRSLFGSALQTRWVASNFYPAQRYLGGCVTTAEVSDLN